MFSTQTKMNLEQKSTSQNRQTANVQQRLVNFVSQPYPSRAGPFDNRIFLTIKKQDSTNNSTPLRYSENNRRFVNYLCMNLLKRTPSYSTQVWVEYPYSTRGRVTRPWSINFTIRLRIDLGHRLLVFTSATNLESRPRFANICKKDFFCPVVKPNHLTSGHVWTIPISALSNIQMVTVNNIVLATTYQMFCIETTKRHWSHVSCITQSLMMPLPPLCRFVREIHWTPRSSTRWNVMPLIWLLVLVFSPLWLFFNFIISCLALPCLPVCKPKAVGGGIAIRAKVVQIIYTTYSIIVGSCNFAKFPICDLSW